jgi:hypothetical protein
MHPSSVSKTSFPQWLGIQSAIFNALRSLCDLRVLEFQSLLKIAQAAALYATIAWDEALYATFATFAPWRFNLSSIIAWGSALYAPIAWGSALYANATSNGLTTPSPCSPTATYR